MSGAGPLVARLLAARLIGIVRLDDLQLAVAAAGAALDAGLGAVEVTFTLPAAPQAIERLRGEHPGALVGAGTVRTVPQIEEASAAGAQFLVAPGLNPELFAAARKRGLPLMPGVLTASEVDLGLRLGAELLKLFPAEPLGPAYLASLMQPFPEARLIPTGGISADNAAAYLNAGAAALAMGSSLFPARRLVERGTTVVAPLVAEALAAIKTVPSLMRGGSGGGPREESP
jgi:2-dehydro-3-deoxyphosphogluconate aldolase/(4S)-4-hydroxy-2-oxoglutarate aldolase